MDKMILWSFLLLFFGSQASRTVAQKSAEFAVDLYKAVCFSHKNNIIFSPLGTTVLLGMVQVGAKGKAQQQILQTLGMQESSAGEQLRRNCLQIWSALVLGYQGDAQLIELQQVKTSKDISRL